MKDGFELPFDDFLVACFTFLICLLNFLTSTVCFSIMSCSFFCCRWLFSRRTSSRTWASCCFTITPFLNSVCIFLVSFCFFLRSLPRIIDCSSSQNRGVSSLTFKGSSKYTSSFPFDSAVASQRLSKVCSAGVSMFLKLSKSSWISLKICRPSACLEQPQVVKKVFTCQNKLLMKITKDDFFQIFRQVSLYKCFGILDFGANLETILNSLTSTQLLY